MQFALCILRIKITLTASFFHRLPPRETENVIESKRLRYVPLRKCQSLIATNFLDDL